MDVVKIGWRDNEAYDDWDDIASTLYKNIVERSIRYAVGVSANTKLPPYDTQISSYADCSYVSVEHEDFECHNLAFVRFSTRNRPFDSVACAAIDNARLTDPKYLFLPLHECEFRLLVRDEVGEHHSIVDVNVEL
jgi:hypothetical protein